MLKKLLTIIITFLLPAWVLAQINGNEAQVSNVFTESKFIKGSFSLMDVDILGNIFLITRENQLKKYNNAGDSIAAWNDVKAYGNPSFMDVSNPMRILIFYKPYATVVMLDRLLTFRNVINLRKKSIFSVSALATSYDNNIWLFDEQNFKLKKINEDGSVISETSDWRLLFPSEVPTPSVIIDHRNSVYCFDENTGLYNFDYYGSLIKSWPSLAGLTYPGISGSFIYGFKDNKMISFDTNTLAIDKNYSIPKMSAAASYMKFANNKLYILTPDGVGIFDAVTK